MIPCIVSCGDREETAPGLHMTEVSESMLMEENTETEQETQEGTIGKRDLCDRICGRQ